MAIESLSWMSILEPKSMGRMRQEALARLGRLASSKTCLRSPTFASVTRLLLVIWIEVIWARGHQNELFTHR